VTGLLNGHDPKAQPPKYGSITWQRLRGDDPMKVAATITAAEMWRKYGDEEALLSWFREAQQTRTPLAGRKTLAELNEAARPKPAVPVQATAGWPPVAIPGQPGWYRHCGPGGEQRDLPHDRSGARAA
jgi:hypothetical protein